MLKVRVSSRFKKDIKKYRHDKKSQAVFLGGIGIAEK
jgi:mRNA-degrading endonuclease YafQ of YafQ-DinJ toxin-antitoxin module